MVKVYKVDLIQGIFFCGKLRQKASPPPSTLTKKKNKKRQRKKLHTWKHESAPPVTSLCSLWTTLFLSESCQSSFSILSGGNISTWLVDACSFSLSFFVTPPVDCICWMRCATGDMMKAPTNAGTGLGLSIGTQAEPWKSQMCCSMWNCQHCVLKEWNSKHFGPSPGRWKTKWQSTFVMIHPTQYLTSVLNFNIRLATCWLKGYLHKRSLWLCGVKP